MTRIWRGGVLCFLAVVFLAPVAGCGSLPFRIEGERPLLGSEGPQRKTVAAKEAPGRLVAVDGTICMVPAAKFESVEVDDKVWCAWGRGE